MENDLKEIENYFELTGGSSYRGFELPGVDCIYSRICNATFRVVSRLFCYITFSFFKFLQGEHTGERLITKKVINFLRSLKFSNFGDDGSENATFIHWHAVSLIFSTSFNWLNVSEFSSGRFPAESKDYIQV